MAKFKYTGGRKKSRFFALTHEGDSLVASFPSPRKIVNLLKRNSRNRDKVFSINGN